MENQITLQDLPSEIKVMIFEHLPADRDLLTVRSVCHGFNNVILSAYSICTDIRGKSQLLSKENVVSFEALTSTIQSSPADILGMGELIESYPLSKAYFFLGEMYLKGLCKQPNYQKAYDCFLKSKDKERLAEYRVIWMHQKGLIEWDPPHSILDFSECQMFWDIANFYVAHNNYEKAAEFYQKAADQGKVNAQVTLGDLYNYGRGVLQDPQKAAEFYQKAADQGHVSAQISLGILYVLGRGVPQDPQKAMAFFQKALSQGCVISVDSSYFRYD